MNLRKFLPVEDYTLTTGLNVDQVNDRLSKEIGEKRTLRGTFWGYVTSRPYEGYLANNTFEISRNIGYMNSFLPLIKGLIYSIAGKTYIKVEMRVIPYILLPTIIAIALFSIIGMVLKDIIGSAVFPLLFPVISYLVVYFAFKIESGISKRFLARLLDGEVVI